MPIQFERPIRVCAALLMLSAADAAWAQSREPEIVVTGTREQQAALEEIEPERSIDEEAVAAYGVSTIGEVLDEIAGEQGDTGQPVLFVNGRPITDPGDIVDYPAEAIERIDVLPRGAGARLGAAPDRRAYNVVLKRVFKSHIGTLRDQLATDGGWNSVGGELIVSRISGQRRLNLTLRVRSDDELLESERSLLQPDAAFPYDLSGNIVADPRCGLAEIDPVLSAIAGKPVLVAGVPVGERTPILADFVAGAGLANRTDLGQYRTLRPAQRNYEAVLNMNRPVTDWLSASLTGRVDLNTYKSLQGLAAGLFIIPAENPYSPFSRPVALARYFEDAAMSGETNYLRSNLGLALNASRGRWQMSLRGDYRFSRYDAESERQQNSPGSPIVLGDADGINPFADGLVSLVPLYTDQSVSHTQEIQLQASATGPVLDLPAGPLRANLNAGWRHVDQSSGTDNPFFQNHRSFDRDEHSAQAGLEIPLTSREREILGALGDLSATLDYGIVAVRGFGTARREGYAVAWQPFPALRLQGAINRQRAVPEAQLIGDPVATSEGVRYFDVLRGETVDVTQIYGGNPDLRGERLRTHRFSATAQLLRDNRLQLNAEYLTTELRDPISTLPPASAELMAAFPDRFIRDADGRLIIADARPINFVSRSSEQVRWGAILSAPLAPTPPPGTPGSAGIPRPRLQLTLSHTINLRDEVLARPGFPVVDLLDGGAIGFGGGGMRHLVDAGINLSDREIGLRLNATWRSGSRLNTGAPGSPGQLRFSPLATLGVRTFADLNQVWPRSKWLKGTRVSLNVANILNDRQRVVDENGVAPLRYQPGYRDPLGRTIELELRKAF